MAMKVVLMLLIAIVRQQLAAADEKPQKYLDLLKRGANCERRSAVLGLYGQGKQAISTLVGHIHDAELAPSSNLLLANPQLSYAPTGSQHDQFAGVLYAYVIELILAKPTLSNEVVFSAKENTCKYLLGLDDYVYGHGLIFYGDELIKADDLPRVEQIYLQWWDRNGNKSLAKMRQEWKASRRPLTGTQYRWF